VVVEGRVEVARRGRVLWVEMGVEEEGVYGERWKKQGERGCGERTN
jgi:hypothetical protein